jgi:hypothetical protein
LTVIAQPSRLPRPGDSSVAAMIGECEEHVVKQISRASHVPRVSAIERPLFPHGAAGSQAAHEGPVPVMLRPLPAIF